MARLGVKPDVQSATETMKQNFMSTAKFLDPRTMGTRIRGAVTKGKNALASAKETGQKLLDKVRGRSKTAAEDLAQTVHEQAAKEGRELVQKLETMTARNLDGAVPGAYLELGELNKQITQKLELQQLVLEVQSNKSAMRYLKTYQGGNAQVTRAVFNNTMLDIYKDVGEAWKTELAATLNVPRSRIGIVNMSGTGIKLPGLAGELSF